MDIPAHADERRIAEQLPVISHQQDSLAAVLLSRWLRLAAPHGVASLHVTAHRRQEQWSLSWHTSTHHTKTLQAPTLAALYSCLLAEMTPEEQQRWSDTTRR
jgi:hypothetical protein